MRKTTSSEVPVSNELNDVAFGGLPDTVTPSVSAEVRRFHVSPAFKYRSRHSWCSHSEAVEILLRI